VPHCGQRGASGAPHWPQNRIPGGFSNWHCPHVIIAGDYTRKGIADISVASTAAGIQLTGSLATRPRPRRNVGRPRPSAIARTPAASSPLGGAQSRVRIAPSKMLPGDASARHERPSLLRPSGEGGRSRADGCRAQSGSGKRTGPGLDLAGLAALVDTLAALRRRPHPGHNTPADCERRARVMEADDHFAVPRTAGTVGEREGVRGVLQPKGIRPAHRAG